PHPLARQLGPGRIDLELPDFPPGRTLGGRWVLRSVPRQHDDEGRECDDQRTRDRAHEVSSVSALIVCYRRRGVLLVPTSPVRLNRVQALLLDDRCGGFRTQEGHEGRRGL